MPFLRKYNAGAVIYMEGDKSKYIYVLKSGKVLLTYNDYENMKEVSDSLKEGDFFGVKSVVGNYKRDEICRVVNDSELLLLTRKDFEELINKNHKIVLDMLKVLSTQLRKIGKKASELISADGADSSSDFDIEEKLYNIAEHYFLKKNYPYASYIFKKYLFLYSNGQFSSIAKERLNSIDSSS